MMKYLMNTWYQAGFADDIPAGGKLARTICAVPLVFYRRAEGSLTALADRCPHRFAPLSAGRVDGDSIFCGYHGLGFGADGKCMHNPHGPIVSALAVRSFPVVERHTIVWVWLGDAERADPALIPDLSYIDETPPQARISGYMPTAANYQLISDNILDLSHADFLHPDTLGGINSTAKTSNRQEGDTVVVDWLAENCEPPPAFRATVHGAGRADVWTEVVWRAPAVMTLGVAAVARRGLYPAQHGAGNGHVDALFLLLDPPLPRGRRRLQPVPARRARAGLRPRGQAHAGKPAGAHRRYGFVVA